MLVKRTCSSNLKCKMQAVCLHYKHWSSGKLFKISLLPESLNLFFWIAFEHLFLKWKYTFSAKDSTQGCTLKTWAPILFCHLPSYPPNTNHGNTGPPNVPKQGSWSKLVSFSDAGALKRERSPAIIVYFWLTAEAQHHRTKHEELFCYDWLSEIWLLVIHCPHAMFELKQSFKGVFLAAKTRSSFYSNYKLKWKLRSFILLQNSTPQKCLECKINETSVCTKPNSTGNLIKILLLKY